VLSDDEIRAAYPKTTQTIEIQTFVRADEIPFIYLDAPYYLEPAAKGDKVYALLREAMLDRGVVGVANVVMHTKQHLAALIPSGPGLVLNTLRWAGEIRPWTELKLPPEGQRGNGITDAEMKMAKQLIGDMTGRWDATRYVDRFSDAVHALAKQRVEAGQTAKVEPVEKDDGAAAGSNVVDLTALLKQSLVRKPAGEASREGAKPAPKAASSTRKSAKSPARKRA
jgi:DNA end-binding protein Ku